ncbi:MAG TPA: sigma-E factor negative regulatory protein [Steroidobacteraceae bacterium]|nr:sigma-E factor negative regulatory protein [Steroidobacteraceae bacterium]
MSDESHSESLHERVSQLSAMFDNELPGAECELLARRLTRDEALRSQWSRFAMIGAALRAERGVALHDRVAWRVQASINQEVTYGDGAAVDSIATGNRSSSVVAAERKVGYSERWLRFARPVLGASIAAGVAATSIFWLRNSEPTDQMLAANPVPQSIVLAPETVGTTVALNQSPSISSTVQEPVSNGEPDRYVTPAPSSQSNFAPPARLANYVVAHSEYSGPLSRRMALLGLVSTDSPVDNSAGVTVVTAPPAARANDAP